MAFVFLSQDKSVLDIISDPSAGTPADKLRLFLIYYTLSPEVTDADLTQFTTALESVGADMTPLKYLKRWRLAATSRVTSCLCYMLCMHTHCACTCKHGGLGFDSRWLPVLFLFQTTYFPLFTELDYVYECSSTVGCHQWCSSTVWLLSLLL